MRRFYVFAALFVALATAAAVALGGCDRSDAEAARSGDVVLTVMFAPDSTGATEYYRLCEEVIDRV